MPIVYNRAIKGNIKETNIKEEAEEKSYCGRLYIDCRR